MNKINELYTQLATDIPQSDRPVAVPEDNFVLPELDEAQQKELGDYINQAYSMYEGLSPAQRLVAEVAPGTGEAISAYEAKKFGEETKEAFQEGKYGEAALKAGLTGLSALGAIPIIGAAARVPKAAAKTVAKKILKEKVEAPKQEFTSAKTSRPQIAAIFKDKNFDIKPGEINIDIGGGKFDKGSDYLKKNKKATNLVYDKFNRSTEHNDKVLNTISKKPADTATVANVLNVIKEPEIRNSVIKEAKDFTKKDGKAFFITYEKKGTGVGEMTKDGFQTNMKTKDYIPEIEKVFGKGNVELKGKTIVATKGTAPLKTKGGSTVKRGGVVKNVEYPVGKNIGGAIYFHKDYISRQPKELQDIYNKAINKLPKDFNFKTIKYDYNNKNIRFEEAPDFDTAREPKVGKNITITPEGDVGKIKDSDLIYHHKWTWVDNDYPGFDVKKEHNWSREWLDKGVDPGAGRKNKWEENLKKAKLPMERN